MPSFEHEALVWLLAERPEQLAELFSALPGISPELQLGRWRVQRVSGELSQVVAPAHLLDFAAAYYDDEEETPAQRPRVALAVEVLHSFNRNDKVPVLPVYQTHLGAQLGCPVELVVVALDDAIAARIPVELPLDYSGSRTRVHVLRREHVPVITDPEQAQRQPELAAWSVLAHGRQAVSVAVPVARAALSAARHQAGERATMLHDIVISGLGEEALAELEREMEREELEYKTEFARRILEQGFGRGVREGIERGVERGKALGRSEGEAQGRREGALLAQEALLSVLQTRGFTLEDAALARLRACEEPETLRRWLRAAVTAERLEDVFTS